MSYDLIALGETMLALTPETGQSLRHAERLLVDHAGAESNTCVGLARLGFHVAWVSRLGADAAGDRILDALRAEHVDTRWVRRDNARPTGLMLKDPTEGVRYYRTGSAASALTADDLKDVTLADARAVLVTGVTALIGPEPHAAGLALLGTGSRIEKGSRTPPDLYEVRDPFSRDPLRIVDPNLRPGLWGSDRRVELVLAYLERCDLLLGSADELAELIGVRDPQTLARRCAEHGPTEVVVRGPMNVCALTPGGEWIEIDVRRGPAVDPIGAGDAFNAGYIAVRLKGGPVDAAIRAGARCGAAVTTALSDTAGFPRSL